MGTGERSSMLTVVFRFSGHWDWPQAGVGPIERTNKSAIFTAAIREMFVALRATHDGQILLMLFLIGLSLNSWNIAGPNCLAQSLGNGSS